MMEELTLLGRLGNEKMTTEWSSEGTTEVKQVEKYIYG